MLFAPSAQVTIFYLFMQYVSILERFNSSSNSKLEAKECVQWLFYEDNLFTSTLMSVFWSAVLFIYYF